jgi:hypothetical protein
VGLASDRGRSFARPEVWLGADTLTWPEGGGNFWPYANWALGLVSNGCRVVWLERVAPEIGDGELAHLHEALQAKLDYYGLPGSLALHRDGVPVPGTLGLHRAARADLFLNLAYDAHAAVLDRFRRTAMLDIDPGRTQVWATEGTCPLLEHDFYFTIGEHVGKPGAPFPDCGVRWEYTPPCVALDWWPVAAVAADAPFTTVTNWDNREWMLEDDEPYDNTKCAAFEPYIDLPARAPAPLELALCLEADRDLRLSPYAQEEASRLERHGWRVRHAYEVSRTPWDYQRYIQRSRGEVSAAKASCRRLPNAWVSDRTLAYLASGRPAVVEHTGDSRFLPDRSGLFRFRDIDEAADCLDEAVRDWPRHARLARGLVEEHFDASVVTAGVLARALEGSPSFATLGSPGPS